jgi:hypothetical protein
MSASIAIQIKETNLFLQSSFRFDIHGRKIKKRDVVLLLKARAAIRGWEEYEDVAD